MAWDDDLAKDGVAYSIASAPETRVRVIAGPGTGKSFAMKRRVAKLLEAGVNPNEILAVTFTRVAAEDLHRELQKLGTPGCDQLSGQTLHSLAQRMLRRKAVLQALGRVARPLNRFERKALLSDLAGKFGGKRQCDRYIQAYESAWAQSQGDEPGFAKTDEEKSFQATLLDWLSFHESMLIGELIPYLVKYLKDNPAAPEHSEFKHLLVDEFQDLNKAEQSAIEYLGASAHVCIVGDDDQSIYSFKHANPDGIREWAKANPGCADLQMADCHRCPTSVVEMANSLITHNIHRDPRVLMPIASKGAGVVDIIQLSSLSTEADFIADQINNILGGGAQPGDIVVLVQRRIVAKPIMEALKAKKIPSRSYYEESQLDSESAQRRFALLKLLLNNDDKVALRYLVGEGSTDFRAKPYARLREHCELTGDTPWQALDKLESKSIKINYAAGLIDAFAAVKQELATLTALVGDLPALIDALFPNDEAALAELRELAIAHASTSVTASELLDAMMESITQPDVPATVDEVRVMSLHKCKGLSSPYVFIAGCVQGILPPLPEPGIPRVQQVAGLEEARRLFFVGITRTKAELGKGQPGTLVLTYAQRMNAGQAYGANIGVSSSSSGMANLIPSIFIGELGATAPKPRRA